MLISLLRASLVCASLLRASLGATLVLAAPLAAAAADADTWTSRWVRTFLDGVSASVVGGDAQVRWGDDDAGPFWYATRTPDGTAYVAFDPQERATRRLFDDAGLRALLSVAPDAALDVQSIDLMTDQAVVFAGGRRAVIDVSGAPTIASIADGPADAVDTPQIVRESFPIANWNRREIPGPDGAAFATLIGDDFGVRRRGATTPAFRTADGAPDHQWHFAGDIWEESGSPWSPDGARIVARRHDMRAVPGVPIVDYLGRRERVDMFKYWARAGEPLPKTQFVIFNAETGAATPAALEGDPDTHDFFIDWSPSGDFFAVLRYARDLSTQTLYFVDAATGAARTVLTDARDDGWVKWPSGPPTLVFLPSGDGFLFRSDADGHFQWRLYALDGALVAKVTHGPFDSGEIIAIDEAGDAVFFLAQSDTTHPYDVHLNRVSLKGEEQRQLTTLRGVHRATASPGAERFVVTHAHLDRPPRTDLLDRDGTIVATLAEASVDAAFRQSWAPPEEFVAKTADGETDVHGLIFKPHDFDPALSYPVIERVYGGMQIPVMKRGYPGDGAGWSGGEYYRMINYLNALGFVVVTMDAPGTPGRGRAFNLATHGDWPNGVIDDHAAALRQIGETRPYMDLARVGVDGNSWGGYIAGRALTDAPDLYRAGALSVPETDLLDHVHWIEWQIGEPDENMAHYEANALSAHVDKIAGDLLILAGASDVNVPVSNTMKLLDALAEADKDYALVFFPGTNHPHQGRGDRYAYAVKRIGAFFRETLGAPQPRD
ncbi:MAG: prolyl oligopeptidase family serine peptidase [Pseudomonadota bacterium]